MRTTTKIRRPGDAKRAPMAPYVPRPVKRASGRAPTPLVPAYIRSVERALDADSRAYVRRKLGMKLGKFAHAIERVSVRVEDVNGPRGGVDKVCRMKVVLSGLPSVVIEEHNASLQATIDRALNRAEGAVRRAVQRRRQRSKLR
jgi:ribosome-associated translation inhibitor RaiA